MNLINSIIYSQNNTQEKSSAFLSRRFAKEIKWVHGTNSSLLTMIPATDYTMLPTGQLLNRQIVPMCGEIKRGGMRVRGVNQNYISGCRARGIQKSWRYANIISHSFNPPANMEESFTKSLELLSHSFPEMDEWDPILVDILRLKQWDPDTFEQLCKKYELEIEAMKKQTRDQGHSRKILNSIDYPIEKLKDARNDLEIRREVDQLFLKNDRSYPDQHWTLEDGDEMGRNCGSALVSLDSLTSDRPNLRVNETIKAIFRLRLYGAIELAWFREKDYRNFFADKTIAKILLEKDKQGNFLSVETVIQKLFREKIEAWLHTFEPRYKRMLDIFNHISPPVSFSKEEDRDLLTHSFPLLFASTTLSTKGENPYESSGECEVPQARIGRDIRLVFTPPEHISKVEEWLKKNHLETRVTVHSSTLIDEVASRAKATYRF